MKKLKPKKVHQLCIISIVVFGLIGLLGASLSNVVLDIICVAGLVGTIIFRLIFFRCPHCGAYLDRSKGQYCPHCRGDVNE